MTPTPRTRRRLLGGLAVAAVGTLAGCSDTSADSESTGDTESTAGEPSELDLREANVVGVEATAQETGYEFAVQLYHDDDGEDGYADWWQVEQLDGTQLGRRELLHAHSSKLPHPTPSVLRTSVLEGVVRAKL